MRILVVEDTAEIRELLAEILGAEGYEVVTANEGQEGLQTLAREHVDLVLLDLMMPVMDGFEFLAALQTRTDAPPVIAMSAFERFRDQARAAGAQSFLGKPVDIDRLLDEIGLTLRAVEGRALGEDGAQASPAALHAGVAVEREALVRWLEKTAEWLAQLLDVESAAVCVRARGDGSVEVVPNAHSGAGARTFAQRLGTRALEHPGLFVSGDALGLLGAEAAAPRFQASLPVRTPAGQVAGALLAFDAKPRTLTGEDLQLLELIARRVGSALQAFERGEAPVAASSLDVLAGHWGSEIVDALLAAECRRARLARRPLALALVRFEDAHGEAMERRVRLLREPFGRGALVGQRRRSEVVLLTRADAPWAIELVRTLERLCAGWLDEAPDRGTIGVATCEAGAEPTAAELLALATIALERAEARGASSERLVLPAVAQPAGNTH